VNPSSPAVVLFTGGDPVPLGTLDDVSTDAFVIAADSGIEHALAHGRRVDLAVGDFDSVSAESLEHVTNAGAILEHHPVAKDKTDLELALDAAVFRKPAHLLVVGGHGGRLDHFVGNITVLVSDAYARVALIEARMGTDRVFVVRRHLDLVGQPGDLVTLLAVNGPVSGITTAGLVYPLNDETLYPGSSRGISNELRDRSASVVVREGTLLVIQPG